MRPLDFTMLALATCFAFTPCLAQETAAPPLRYPPVIRVEIDKGAVGPDFTVTHGSDSWAGEIRMQLPVVDGTPVAVDPKARFFDDTGDYSATTDVQKVGGTNDHRLVIVPASGKRIVNVELSYKIHAPLQWQSTFRARRTASTSSGWELVSHNKIMNTMLVAWGSSGQSFEVVVTEARARKHAFHTNEVIAAGQPLTITRPTAVRTDPETVWLDAAQLEHGALRRHLHLNNTIARSRTSRVVATVGPGNVRLEDASGFKLADLRTDLQLGQALSVRYDDTSFLQSRTAFWTQPPEQAWLEIGRDERLQLLDVEQESNAAWLPLSSRTNGTTKTFEYLHGKRIRVDLLTDVKGHRLRLRSSKADTRAYWNVDVWTSSGKPERLPIIWLVGKQDPQVLTISSSPTSDDMQILRQLRDNVRVWNHQGLRNQLLPVFASKLKQSQTRTDAEHKLERHLTGLAAELQQLAEVAESASVATQRTRKLYDDVFRLSQTLHSFRQSRDADQLWREIRRTEFKLDDAMRAYKRSRQKSLTAKQELQWLLTAREEERLPLPWEGDREPMPTPQPEPMPTQQPPAAAPHSNEASIEDAVSDLEPLPVPDPNADPPMQ